MCSPNTPQIQPVVVWNQEHSETQLHTVSVSVTTKMLGFTRFLFDVTSMEWIDFSIVFQGFGGIRSTQPTELFFNQIQVFLPFRFIATCITCMNEPHIKPPNKQNGNISNIILKSHSSPFKTSHISGKTSKATHKNPPK